jgi:DNA-binding MarR family transcriptional regulator
MVPRPAPASGVPAPFRAPDASPARSAADLETRSFFISRVSTLNVLLKRRAAIYAKRAFGMTLIEWRIITLLPTLQPISIRELAVHALVDAAQVSRGISRLVGKGFLSRRQSDVDSREALIVLTPAGMALSIEMFNASLKRNDQLLREHTPTEIDFLNEALDALIVRARNLVGEDDAQEALKKKAARKPRSVRS